MLKSLLPSLTSGVSRGLGLGGTGVTKRHVERRVLRACCPRRLWRIITDVDAYEGFLPLCHRSRILRHHECGRAFDAVLEVGIGAFVGRGDRGGSIVGGLTLPTLSEEYVSRVEVDEDALTVEATSLRGQWIDRLRSRWKLRELSPPGGNGHKNEGNAQPWCDVEFEVEMHVSDPLVIGVLDHVLRDVAERQVTAFEARYREVSHDEQHSKEIR